MFFTASLALQIVPAFRIEASHPLVLQIEQAKQPLAGCGNRHENLQRSMEQRPRTPGHRVSTRSRKIRTPFAFRIWQVSSVLTPCRWYTVQGRIVVDLRWATQGGAVLPTPTRCATGYARPRKPPAARPVCRRISLSSSMRCGRGQNYRTKTDVVSLTPQPPNAWPGRPMDRVLQRGS